MEICNEKMTIVQGETINLPVTIILSNGKPYSLAGATEIKFCINDDNNSTLVKKLSENNIIIDNDVLGEMTIKLTGTDTASLKSDENQSFDVEITNAAGESRIAKFIRLLNVEKRVCSI